jgi:hypothetical protein
VAALDGLANALRGGVSKKVAANNKQRALERRASDGGKLHDFPTVPEMKEAVTFAMMCLNRIASTCGGSSVLPRGVQAEATAALVGIVWFNGFGGRKLEWEAMPLDHARGQLQQGLDYLVCGDGSLAKWLAPGTVEAIKVYMGLPRDNAVKTLFVPCFSDRVCIPGYLRRFYEAYLPSGRSRPTVNLLRKWCHTELSKVARSEDALMGLMQTVDAHSKRVARQHYVLQTPADDASLAKALVHAMIGEPVPWPAVAELGDTVARLGSMLKDAEGELDLTVDGQTDEEDEDLEWWDGADAFGVQRKSLLAIADGTCHDDARSARGPSTSSGMAASSSCCAAAAAATGSSSAAAAPAPSIAKPPPKKPKRMSREEKAWIEGYHKLRCLGKGLPANAIPERQWFTKARESGIEGKNLNTFVTAEGLRSHIRAVCGKTIECEQDIVMDLN